MNLLWKHWVQTPIFRLLNDWSSWPFLGGLRIPTEDPKQVQAWSVKVGLQNFIENILLPKELGSNSETNLQTVANWSFDKLNKASLCWPCDDIVNKDFGFNEKIPSYLWLIHSGITCENFNRLRFVPMVQILAALQPKFAHSVIYIQL